MFHGTYYTSFATVYNSYLVLPVWNNWIPSHFVLIMETMRKRKRFFRSSSHLCWCLMILINFCGTIDGCLIAYWFTMDFMKRRGRPISPSSPILSLSPLFSFFLSVIYDQPGSTSMIPSSQNCWHLLDQKKIWIIQDFENITENKLSSRLTGVLFVEWTSIVGDWMIRGIERWDCISFGNKQ